MVAGLLISMAFGVAPAESAPAHASSPCGRMVGTWQAQGTPQIGTATIRITQDGQTWVVHLQNNVVNVTLAGRCAAGHITLDGGQGELSYLPSSDSVMIAGATYHRQ